MANELLAEVRNYEEAQRNTVIVEKMEKLLYKGLAQKDHEIVAYKMKELKLELRKDRVGDDKLEIKEGAFGLASPYGLPRKFSVKSGSVWASPIVIVVSC